jgi:ribosome biogenesis protein BMS1
MIKYTPDHLHCIANFYGPMTPQGTGILGIAPSDFDGFRITLTGTVLDMDKSSELVKKLKLVGSPAKIFKKSAFIEGMFSSQLEVAKFVGAKIKTVSGIRGVIKKELRTPVGAFRATFEDKIVQSGKFLENVMRSLFRNNHSYTISDIVFCRTWARAEVPKFFLNLPTLITAQPRVMKTVGQLKRERQIQVEPNQDNLYTPIERQAKRFRPLKIPKSLQQKLPYNEKPKVLAKLTEQKRIAVIKDPHELQVNK